MCDELNTWQALEIQEEKKTTTEEIENNVTPLVEDTQTEAEKVIASYKWRG